MSHASIPAEVRAARGLPDDLVRISTGIEDVGDLIADLKQAMDLALADRQRRQQQQQGVAGSSSDVSSSSSSSSSGNGVGVAVPAAVASGTAGADGLLAAAHGREHELLQRIQQLEAQLAGSNGRASRV